MKKTALLLACTLLLLSCSKDRLGLIPEGALRLRTESYTGNDKTAIANTTEVTWVDGDLICISNGTASNTYPVVVADSCAYIANTLGGDLRGYYPADILAADHPSTPTLAIPARYASTASNGTQVIGLPMVGSALSGATTINLRHLTAAVNIRLRNSTAHTLYIDSVSIATDSSQINGTITPTLAPGTAPTVAASYSATAANRTNTVHFSTAPAVSTGAVIELQVPLLPTVADNLTIQVFAHNQIEGVSMAGFLFSHKAAIPALARNTIITAQIDISPTSSRVTTIGTFSVGSNKKVYFACGNLQYKPNTNQWRLAEEQYTYIGTSNSRISSTLNSWIDLFGWGTSGYDNTANDAAAIYFHPYDYTIASAAVGQYNRYGYGPSVNMPSSDLTGASSNYDWGVFNTIKTFSGNTTGPWRTLTKEEWDYLLFQRSASTLNGTANARFAKVRMTNNSLILMIFPDNYSHPNNLTLPTQINNTTAPYNANIYTKANVSSMINAGAIAIPAGGCRERNSVLWLEESNNYYGMYWTSTRYDFKDAYHILFNKNQLVNTQCSRYVGASVRLVRDLQ